MPTRIRLRRTGRKGQGYFRIVVAHQEMARDGRVVATLGHYNPRANPAVIQVDAERARAWLDKGATPTDTVRSLLRKAGVLHRAGAAPETTAPTAPPAGE
jgi:small subunit ribosomal protein S16